MQMNWKGEFAYKTAAGWNKISNTLTYTGIQHLTRSLSGNVSRSAVTHLYLRFGSALGDSAKTFTTGLFRENDGVGGAIYIPLLCPPVESSSVTGIYTANRLEFRFSIPVNDIIADTANVWKSNSNFASGDVVYALGVASAQDFQNRNSDILVASSKTQEEWTLIEDTVVPCTYTVTLDIGS